MIEGFLNDLRKMSMFGVVVFFIGFLLSAAFLIFLGVSTTFTGYSLFKVVSKEYEKQKEKA